MFGGSAWICVANCEQTWFLPWCPEKVWSPIFNPILQAQCRLHIQHRWQFLWTRGNLIKYGWFPFSTQHTGLYRGTIYRVWVWYSMITKEFYRFPTSSTPIFLVFLIFTSRFHQMCANSHIFQNKHYQVIISFTVPYPTLPLHLHCWGWRHWGDAVLATSTRLIRNGNQLQTTTWTYTRKCRFQRESSDSN